MPLSLATCAAKAPIFFALTTFARSFASACAFLPCVEVAASVTRATSSMNCTMMCWLEKRTLIRGRSRVPDTFLRMRQCRSLANFSFLSVLMLLHRLAFLAPHFLVRVTHALAFVRFGRIVTAQLRRDLP